MMLREIWDRLTTWGQRDRLAAEVEAELQAHAELLARDFEQDGLTRDAALAAARRQLGHVSTQREATRDAWGFPAIDIVIQDARYAIRGLRRSPVFTATAVITLGLGIGANAAMFAVIDRLMFRPFPYMKDPSTAGRVYLQTTRATGRNSNMTFPYTRFADIQSELRSFSSSAAISEWRLAVGTGSETRVRKVAGVSASMFEFFDARPVVGRFFGPADDVLPLGNLVAVLSHGYWQSGFGADSSVIGRRLRVGTLDYSVIGVAPEGFIGATSGRLPEIFVPVTTIPATMSPGSRDTYYRTYDWDWVEMLVRRKPGISREVADAELSEAYRRSRAKARVTNPRVLPDSIAHPAAIAGPIRTMAGPDAGLESRVLLWVTGVAGIVLLIACANVTNLMLARILRRRREIALRLALGVSRGRLAAQFITEALTLALLGAVAGLLVAQWAGSGIRALLLPEGSTFNLAADPRTIAAAIVVSSLAASLTVIAPLVLAMRSDLAAALKAGARDGGYRSSWLRTSLLVAQGGLSVALLVGAGLFVRSLDNVLAIPLGYDVSTVLDIHPDFRGDEPDSARRVALRRRMLAAAQAIPGVEAATRINSPVFSTNTTTLRVPGIDSVEKLGRFNFQLVTPDYFRVMRTRILRGRGFDGRDGEGSSRSVVVSASMARVVWPGKEALGQCIQVELGSAVRRGAADCVTVVGIAENVASQGMMDEQRLMYYLPVDQIDPSWGSTMYVRMASDDVDASIERVRRAMQAAMPGDGFVIVTPVQKRVDDQRRVWRLGATLFLAFGALALIVAAVGLYGVMGYNVAQRMHELGVRIALGAGRVDILSLVMRDALAVALGGVAIGLAIALAGSRWLQPLLYEQSARDPVTYAIIGGLMIVVAVLASAAPAARAAGADPNRALRSE